MVDGNGEPFYPLTQYNQIVMPDGSRWDGKGGGAQIDDTSASTEKVYSSQKTQYELDQLSEQIEELDAADVGALPVGDTAADSAKLGGVVANKYALKTDIKEVVLLWVNSSPTSTFTAHTVELDLSKYDFVAIECNVSTTYPYGLGAIIYAKTANNRFYSIEASYFTNRTIPNISNSGVEFGGGGRAETYGGGAQSNDEKCIPVRIYGIKGRTEL